LASGGRLAELRRAGSGWTFFVDDQLVETFDDPAEALKAIPRYSFAYTTAIVTARIADLLFQGAVETAEEGLRLYRQSLAMTIRANMEMAEKYVEPNFLQAILAVPLDDPVDFTIATVLLDRSLRRSITAIGLAVSAAEAQVNDWAAEKSGWRNREDFEPLVKKMNLVAARFGSDIDIGRSPFQELQSLVDLRNEFISGSSSHLPPGNELQEAGVVAMSVSVLDVVHDRPLQGGVIRVVGVADDELGQGPEVALDAVPVAGVGGGGDQGDAVPPGPPPGAGGPVGAEVWRQGRPRSPRAAPATFRTSWVAPQHLWLALDKQYSIWFSPQRGAASGELQLGPSSVERGTTFAEICPRGCVGV
jgi:hypothetical protein